MGIDIDLIASLELGKENCTCAICHDLLQDAVMLKCEHSFCRECIDQLIYTSEKLQKKTEQCPECRADFDTLNDVKTPFLFMRKQFSLIQLKCQFHTEGCTEIVGYDMFVSHVNECEYDPDYEVECDYCCEKYKLIETDDHNNDCIDYLRNEVKELSSPIIKHRGNVICR